MASSSRINGVGPGNNEKLSVAGNTMPPPRFRAMAFGRNYFHCMGGMIESPYRSAASPPNVDEQNPSPQLPAGESDSCQEDAGMASEFFVKEPTQAPHVDSALMAHYTSWDAHHCNRLASCWSADADAKDTDESVVTSIACSAQSTLFLTRSGKLYQTGMLHGRLYTRPQNIRLQVPLKCVQIAAGRHFCLARLEGGRAVLSFGAGHFGQLGVVMTSSSRGSGKSGTEDDDEEDDDATPTNANAPITFTHTPVVIERLLPQVTGSPCASIAAGDWHALALTETGRVWAWGANRMHQCGRRSATPANQSGGGGAPTIVAPLPVTLESDRDENGEGMRRPNRSSSRELKVLQISAGKAHSAAVVDGGQVYCWGSSQHGQCGNVVRRSGIFPPRKVQGFSDHVISQVSCGADHTMALSSEGKVFCWGGGTEGQLGIGHAVQAQVKPRQVADIDFMAIAQGQEWKQQQWSGDTTQIFRDACACDDGVNNHEIEGAHAEDTEKEMYQPLEEVCRSEPPKITKIFAGPLYSVAVSSAGHVYTWGSNDESQVAAITPDNVPFKDNLNPSISNKTSTIREVHCCTFDSKHNLLLPVRVHAATNLFVTDVAGGPNHLWLLGCERTRQQGQIPVGRTLYELQEEMRIQKLKRARKKLLAKGQGSMIDEGCTDFEKSELQIRQDTDFEIEVSPDRLSGLSISMSIISTDTVGSEGDGSRIVSSATTTPLGVPSFEVHQVPSLAEKIKTSEASSILPFSEAVDAHASPSHASPSHDVRRGRFVLPKIFRRLSLGKHRTPQHAADQKDEQNLEWNHDHPKKSKRKSH